MALIHLPRIFSNNVIRTGAVLCQPSKFFRIQSSNITSKEFRDPDIKKPAPWPYKTKKFTFLRGYFEGTVKRFDENTKVIVVEGNIGAGKSYFAKQIAEAFDMVYFPEPTMEPYFVTAYGYDIRKIDHLLPPSYKCCDIDTFYQNPYHQNVAKYQYKMYMFRLLQYIDGLAHVLNTGQGVVLDRSVYSDFVFMETMYKFGYVSTRVLDLYNDIQKNTLEELLRPHLIIYLDISADVALDRIKQRNIPAEVNSKVLNKEYLETLEYFYKQKYLKEMQRHAELLVYDWNNYGDIEVVIEDIERLDFEKYTRYDLKLDDWRKEDDWEWNHLRRYYTNEKIKIADMANIFRPKVSEVFHPGEEVEEFIELLFKIPGEKYAVGFNRNAGDKVLWKLDQPSYWTDHQYRINR